MSDLKNVIVIADGPIKNAPALHGADIGYVYASGNVSLTVDYDTLDDGWVLITNPETWRNTNQRGWIKWSRCAVDDPTVTKILLTIKYGTVTAKIVE